MKKIFIIIGGLLSFLISVWMQNADLAAISLILLTLTLITKNK